MKLLMESWRKYLGEKYSPEGKCVYKGGEKVGCTKGPVEDYLAALHANVPDATNESAEESREIILVPINNILPTEELGHGKEHICPGTECDEIVREKEAQIESGIFEPLQVSRHKPIETARLQGKEDFTPSEKHPAPEPFFHIINGHHRLLAAQNLGITKIPCLVVDDSSLPAKNESD